MKLLCIIIERSNATHYYWWKLLLCIIMMRIVPALVLEVWGHNCSLHQRRVIKKFRVDFVVDAYYVLLLLPCLALLILVAMLEN